MDEPLYLDVRTVAEFTERHLEPSTNIPVDALPSRLDELGSKDRRIVVYCRSGGRSLQALRILRAAGFVSVENAKSLDNAAAWRERGASRQPSALPSSGGALWQNVARWERGLRVVAGLVLLSLTVVGPQTPWGLTGLVPLLTGAAGFCPLYRIFGLSSCRLPRASAASKPSASPVS